MQKHLLLKIWIVCALGLFVDGFDLYISSVAEPLFKTSLHLSPLALGITQSSALIGATIGAILVGRLTDKLGRKSILIFNFLLFVGAALLSALSWNVYSLCCFRFLVGFGVGADYPVCAAYLAEMSPNHSRGKLMASAMFINCLASPIGVAIAYAIFSWYPHQGAWRLMFAFGAIPASFALILRAKLPESFLWQASKRMLATTKTKQIPFKTLFNKKYLTATLALCLSWMLMDISYYSIGLFTPDILSALNIVASKNFITDTKAIVESTIFINSFIAVGAFLAIFLIDQIPRVRLQKLGFFVSFLALFVLASSFYYTKNTSIELIFTCFVLYNVFLNMGPDATTYLLPAEIYPTEIKGSGHGLASGTAKFGAFIGTICLPAFQKAFGVHITLFLLSLALLLGYFLTKLLDHKSLVSIETYSVMPSDGIELNRV